MLRNYIKTAIRAFVRHKVQSFLSIMSMTTGLAVTILILLFAKDEFSYDRYHRNADRLYRMVNNWKGGDEITPWARTSTPMADALKSEFPEVEEVVRVRKNPRTDLIEFAGKKFYESGLYFADPQIFKVFTFPLLVGDAATALADKYSVVMTLEMAKKYFGDENPIGKVLRYDNTYDLTVTGILANVPSNSHFQFDFLADFETAKEVLGERRTGNWFWFDIHTYVLMYEGTDPEILESKLPAMIAKNIPERFADYFGLYFQPISSIHLHSADGCNQLHEPNHRQLFREDL